MVRTEINSFMVLIPCFNEEGRVGSVIHDIRMAHPEASIVVIDDASADRTGEEAANAGATVLRHPCNLGYGAALETGYLFAVRCNANRVVQMDGDGQHPASEIPLLLAPFRDRAVDIVLGSRYMGSGTPQASTWMRRIGHRFFSAIIILGTGRRFSDPTSGFQALNRRALEFFASGVFPCDYPDSDVIMMSILSGLHIAEVPVRMEARAGGKSMHAGLKPLYYGMKMLLSIFIVLLNLRSWRRWWRIHGSVPGERKPLCGNGNSTPPSS